MPCSYTQTRYAEPTGWKAPASGGPTSKQLSADQKVIDRQARLTISRELGHDREQITAVYLGRGGVRWSSYGHRDRQAENLGLGRRDTEPQPNRV